MTVSVKPKGKRSIIVSAEIKRRIPEPGALPVPLFLDRKGRLVSEDPDQGKLFEPETIDGRSKAAGGAAA